MGVLLVANSIRDDNRRCDIRRDGGLCRGLRRRATSIAFHGNVTGEDAERAGFLDGVERRTATLVR